MRLFATSGGKPPFLTCSFLSCSFLTCSFLASTFPYLFFFSCWFLWQKIAAGFSSDTLSVTLHRIPPASRGPEETQVQPQTPTQRLCRQVVRQDRQRRGRYRRWRGGRRQ